MTTVTSYLDKHCPVCVLQLWSWSVWPNVTLDNVDKSIAEWMVGWMDGRVDGWSGWWTKYFTVSESVIMVEKLCSSWIWTVDTFTAVALVSEPLQHRLFPPCSRSLSLPLRSCVPCSRVPSHTSQCSAAELCCWRCGHMISAGGLSLPDVILFGILPWTWRLCPSLFRHHPGTLFKAGRER